MNRIMYRKEAETYCLENGYKLFLDLCIKEKIIVMEKEIITLFETSSNSEYQYKYGTIRIEEWNEGLVLWVGGEIRYKSWK